METPPGWCSGGGRPADWVEMTRSGMVRCSVCNRRLHFRSNPDSCVVPCVNPTVPAHKPKTKKRRSPGRKERRVRLRP